MLSLLLLSSSLCLAAPPVTWRTDYAGATAMSQQFGCPLLVVVECPECTWCIALDRATWSDEGVKKVLRENYVAVRIDGEREKELAIGLWVRRYPTIILAAPDGTVLSFEDGFADPGTMQFRLKRAVADAAAMSLRRKDGVP